MNHRLAIHGAFLALWLAAAGLFLGHRHPDWFRPAPAPAEGVAHQLPGPGPEPPGDGADQSGEAPQRRREAPEAPPELEGEPGPPPDGEAPRMLTGPPPGNPPATPDFGPPAPAPPPEAAVDVGFPDEPPPPEMAPEIKNAGDILGDPPPVDMPRPVSGPVAPAPPQPDPKLEPAAQPRPPAPRLDPTLACSRLRVAAAAGGPEDMAAYRACMEAGRQAAPPRVDNFGPRPVPEARKAPENGPPPRVDHPAPRPAPAPPIAHAPPAPPPAPPPARFQPGENSPECRNLVRRYALEPMDPETKDAVARALRVACARPW